MDMEPLYWLIALAVFLFIEILTLGLTTIWFAGGSLVAFFVALFHAPVLAQFIVFFTVSFVLLIFTRPVFEKKLKISREKTNIDSMIGREGRVTTEIDNFNQKGDVQIGGLQWTARSSKDGVVIPVGAKVVVEEIKGVCAIVRLVENDEKEQ